MARIVTVLARSLVALPFVALLACFGARPAPGAGFLLQEQTGRGLGSAFAGEAAIAMDPATVYFNPAGMVLLPGTQFAGSGFAVYTRFNFENRGTRFTEAVGGGPIPGNSGGNGGGIALLPTFFLTHQLHERVSVGIGLSAPFGLETDWPRGWVGRYHARLSRLQSINVNPSIAVRVTDWMSIGAGANAQWLKARLTNNLDMGTICQLNVPSLGVPPSVCTDLLGLQPGEVNGFVVLRGSDWSAGWNLGVLFMPSERTRIGLTYRSRIKQTLSGEAEFTVPRKAQVLVQQSGALVNTPATASINTPDRASISLWQQVTDDLHFLADVTWTNWSLFDKLVLQFQNPNQPDTVQPENWRNSLRYALGLVYVLNPMWSFRSGFAYDESPIRDRIDRTPRIPDSDRYWLAVGIGIRPTNRIRIDLSYAHIFSPQVSTRNVEPTSRARLIGNFDSNADLFGFQLTYDVDWTFSDPMGESVL